MTRRVAVSSTIGDARARHCLSTLKTVFPEASLSGVSTTLSYTVDARLTPKELQTAAERLTNPVIENYSLDDIPRPREFSYCIEIGYLPGVTDTVGHTVKETVEEAAGRKFRAGEAVYSSTFFFLAGPLQ